MEGNLNLTLKIWRQKNAQTDGKFETYQVSGISTDMSFLEMIDVLNNRLIQEGDDPVAFDHDCREGICGMCSMYINGRPHGPNRGVTTCQLHMRSFKDGETITVEPWRASAFPVIKDLVVNRSAFDRIIAAGVLSQSIQGMHKMQITCRSIKMMRMMLLPQQLVSVVALVWQPAKMHLPCYLLQPKYPN